MHKSHRWFRCGSVVLLAVIVGAMPAVAAEHVVNQAGLAFVPDEVTVVPGDTVRWVWSGGVHTVTSGAVCTPDGLFDSLLTSAVPEFVWTVPDMLGDVPYYCIPHCTFGMTGVIHVTGPPLQLVITLDGDQVNPAVDTAASGSGTATFSESTNLLSWEIEFSGLEGTETAAHFHGAAVACENAGVQVGLSTGSPKIGSQVLTPTQAADVLAGRWYVNIHTTAHASGEIRGQVMPAPLENPIAELIPTGDINILLETVATDLTAPNWGTAAPGDDRLFVTDQDGTLWAIDTGTGAKDVFLDVSSRLVSLGVFGEGTFDERGLLGVAFHPDYETNGLLYTYTSEPDTGTADFTTLDMGETPNHQAVIAEWQVPSPGDPESVVNPLSRRELLRIDEPQFNHDGGAISFGPDGTLYVALGDGGGADDRDGQDFIGGGIIGHGCAGNGADNTTVLGTILRIDPDGTDSENGQYGVPLDNPFVGFDGVDEIFAYGLRNPFRFSFDSMTGDLYVGDVGQNDIEEINIVTSGGHYGWGHKEGSAYFVFNGNEPGYVTDMPLDVPGGLTDPIAEYDHDDGTAVVGGFVYRGSAFPALEGRYVFGDFAQTFSNDGRLFYLDESDEIREFVILGQEALGMSLLGFGQDADGELYVLANGTGTPFGDTGVVLRIASPAGDMNCDGNVDFDDIDPFVLALSGQAGYEAAYPDCNWMNADANGDGNVDFDDIDAFVAILSGG